MTNLLNLLKCFYICVWYNYSLKSSFDVSIKRFLLEKNLQLYLVFSNILKSDKVTMSYVSNNINQSYRQYNDSQNIRFTILYKFGNNKVGVKQRKLGNQEEQQRAN